MQHDIQAEKDTLRSVPVQNVWKSFPQEQNRYFQWVKLNSFKKQRSSVAVYYKIHVPHSLLLMLLGDIAFWNTKLKIYLIQKVNNICWSLSLLCGRSLQREQFGVVSIRLCAGLSAPGKPGRTSGKRSPQTSASSAHDNGHDNRPTRDHSQSDRQTLFDAKFLFQRWLRQTGCIGFNTWSRAFMSSLLLLVSRPISTFYFQTASTTSTPCKIHFTQRLNKFAASIVNQKTRQLQQRRRVIVAWAS